MKIIGNTFLTDNRTSTERAKEQCILSLTAISSISLSDFGSEDVNQYTMQIHDQLT